MKKHPRLKRLLDWRLLLVCFLVLSYPITYLSVRAYGTGGNYMRHLSAGDLRIEEPENIELRAFANKIFIPARYLDEKLTDVNIDFEIARALAK